MKIRSTVLPVIMLFVFISGINATSLWNRRGRLYSEKRIFQVGDIITIIIDENASADGKSVNDRQKDVTFDMQPGRVRATQSTTTGGKAASNISNSFPSLVFDIQNELEKEIRNSRSGKLAATISVPIIKIFENGNIELKGAKLLRINDEEEEIIISGVARPKDITSENTIRSSLLANAKIKYKGGMTLSGKDKKKRGIFTKILDGIVNFLF